MTTSRSKKKRLVANWCPIRDNEKIRTVIKISMDRLGLTGRDLSKKAKIDEARISKYLNGKYPSITAYDVFEIATILGIKINIDVKFDG